MEEGTLEEVTRAAEVMQAVEAVRAVGAVGVELPVADLLIDRGQRGIRMRPKEFKQSTVPALLPRRPHSNEMGTRRDDIYRNNAYGAYGMQPGFAPPNRPTYPVERQIFERTGHRRSRRGAPPRPTYPVERQILDGTGHRPSRRGGGNDSAAYLPGQPGVLAATGRFGHASPD
ncbi:hypothetical protein Q9189_003949 [Teloschistes chrysophthalmus]